MSESSQSFGVPCPEWSMPMFQMQGQMNDEQVIDRDE
jgi:hypothetical protein